MGHEFPAPLCNVKGKGGVVVQQPRGQMLTNCCRSAKLCHDSFFILAVNSIIIIKIPLERFKNRSKGDRSRTLSVEIDITKEKRQKTKTILKQRHKIGLRRNPFIKSGLGNKFNGAYWSKPTFR